MSSFNKKEYNRHWSHHYKAQKTWERDLKRGHCPVCSMLLISQFHIKCPYLSKEDKTTHYFT